MKPVRVGYQCDAEASESHTMTCLFGADKRRDLRYTERTCTLVDAWISAAIKYMCKLTRSISKAVGLIFFFKQKKGKNLAKIASTKQTCFLIYYLIPLK